MLSENTVRQSPALKRRRKNKNSERTEEKTSNKGNHVIKTKSRILKEEFSVLGVRALNGMSTSCLSRRVPESIAKWKSCGTTSRLPTFI